MQLNYGNMGKTISSMRNFETCLGQTILYIVA